MVHPRQHGLVTLSKLIAVCALASSLQLLKAQDATVDATSAVVCTASAGDIAVGIQAIPDSTCVDGGLGCFSSECRFCKYSETSNSAHLLACSGFEYDFPALASNPASTTAATVLEDCAVSQGDYAVGVRAVTDASCASGGLGCYSDNCRFCKGVVTPQSAHLADCSTFTASTEAPVVETTVPVVDTAAPVVAMEAPAVDTEAPAVATIVPVVATTAPAVDTVAPVVGTVAPVVDTVAPDVATDAPVVVDTIAPSVVTEVPAVDTAAPVVNTVVPVVPYPEIPVETTAAPATEEPLFNETAFSDSQCVIDDAFKALGIDVVKDLTVTSVDLDYYIDGCRFCKRVDSIELESFTFCARFPSYVDSGVAIIPPTAAPVADIDTLAPIVDTPAPVVETEAPVDASPVCTTPVSQGDAAVGIQIITDATCVNGGLGCIDSLCRFCKVTTTAQSGHLNDCSELLNPSTAVPVTPTECTATLSVGDAAAGIQIITDTDCVYGGLGCFNQVCRFCKVTTTAQSAHLDDCSKYPGATTTEPIFDPSAVTATTCSIDSTYKSLGIDVAADTSVSATDDDYYMDGCRFCKLFDSAESSTFTICTSIAGYGTTTTPKCTQVVSSGDAAVGINITTDSSCASGGIGCITSICRFCKVTTTPQSTSFVSCSDIGTSSTTTTSTTSAPATTVAATAIPLTCTSTISGGDAAVGLDVVTDPSCGDGGIGCISSICRYCKRFVTTQSSSYMSCSDVKIPDMSTITFIPIPAVTTATTDAPVVTTSLTLVNAATNTVVVTTTAPTTTAPATTAPATTAPATIAPGTTAPVTTAPATTAPATTAPATTAPATTAPATTAPATTAPATTAPTVTTQEPATAAPTTAAPVTTAPAATTCGTVSPGDSAVGLTIVADANCLTYGGLGCIGGTACKFCKVFDTIQSSSYAYCPGYPTAALSALRVQGDADGAASETKLASGIHDLLSSNPGVMYAAAAAACVGVLAAIVAIVVGAKRAVRRIRRSTRSSSSASVDDSEGEDRTVLSAVTKDSATVTGVGSDEEVGEV